MNWFRWNCCIIVAVIIYGFSVIMAVQEYKLGLLVPYKTVKSHLGNDFFKGERFASAMSIAVEEVNADPNLLRDYNLTFTWNDSECNELVAVRAQLQQINTGVKAFFGPGCSCKTAARNAAAFNMSIISFMCSNPELSNKAKYPTFARTLAVDTQVVPSLLALVKNTYKWKRVGIICEELSEWEAITETLENEFPKQGVEIAVVKKLAATNNYGVKHVKNYRAILRSVKQDARIILLMMSFNMAREGLYLAKLEGMINDDNKFAFIILVLNQMIVRRFSGLPFFWFDTLILPVTRPRIVEEFRAALVLTVKSPNSKTYEDFQDKVRNKTEEAPFHSKIWVNKTAVIVSVYGAYLYDAVHVYAVALNKTLALKQDPTGKAIFDNLKDVTFMSIQGYQIHLDNNGDAEFNLTLRDLRGKGTLAVLEPIGDFQMVFPNQSSGQMQGIQRLVFNRNTTKLWPGGNTVAPKDSPKCGFKGELCPDEPTIVEDNKMEIIAGVSGALGFLAIILVVNLVRQYRLERDLKSRLWKIDYSELTFERRGSTTSLASAYIVRDNDGDGKLALIPSEENSDGKVTTVAHYKGTLVTVAKFPRCHIDVTRKVLLELKLMRDVRHDNLNQFMGACVEPQMCIVMQYCSRGSLQDILENSAVQLDRMFIASLVADIVKGMAYLHSTDIKSHGNLKSSNCLVDSRWVLKITDYGLPSFRSKDTTHKTEYECCRDLLWTAPELLRLPNLPARGTQKGDVYSFAIILQEFHSREGPYSLDYLEPGDIISRVKDGVFRPTVPQLISGVTELRDVMKQCWEENPEDRHDFHELKKIMHKILINNGMKTNIFDNIVYMMEKYADNLEELVQERTEQLYDEKKKTDALLERMLPSPVAEQLKKGKTVEAETFSEVSIYFSDIVGFTSLSSESTPMQVVTLLNDLYTLFDNIIEGYDVYKVETIGDAYMVVSGLPLRNGHMHAGEISRMALHLVEAVKNNFRVQHKPDYKLLLRVGIHSGSVVAGVVGNTMPRYCLFGDTVNMASRMESNGEALRVHISGSTKQVLDELGGFTIEKRGEVFLKGKGNCVTYWLIDADDKSTCAKLQPKHQLQPNGQPLMDYLTAGLHGGSCASLHLKRNDSLRRSTKTAASPVPNRKFQRFEDDATQGLLSQTVV